MSFYNSLVVLVEGITPYVSLSLKQDRAFLTPWSNMLFATLFHQKVKSRYSPRPMKKKVELSTS